jgi:hypothetical protein
MKRKAREGKARKGSAVVRAVRVTAEGKERDVGGKGIGGR